MIVAPELLAVLADCNAAARVLVMPSHIERKAYADLVGLLKMMGGEKVRPGWWTWPPGVDVRDLLDQVIITGEVGGEPANLNTFDTPEPWAEALVELADVRPRMQVLEPSMGLGGLAIEAIAAGGDVEGYESNPARAMVCAEGLVGSSCICADFLTVAPEPKFDRVVMVPPFGRQADIAHIRHALAFLKPDGVLVALMSRGALDRGNLAAVEFRRLLADRGAELQPWADDALIDATSARATRVRIYGPAHPKFPGA